MSYTLQSSFYKFINKLLKYLSFAYKKQGTSVHLRGTIYACTLYADCIQDNVCTYGPLFPRVLSSAGWFKLEILVFLMKVMFLIDNCKELMIFTCICERMSFTRFSHASQGTVAGQKGILLEIIMYFNTHFKLPAVVITVLTTVH